MLALRGTAGLRPTAGTEAAGSSLDDESSLPGYVDEYSDDDSWSDAAAAAGVLPCCPGGQHARPRTTPGPGDGPLSAHVTWKTALNDTGWLPRSRADLSGSAGWRGDSGSVKQWPFKSYATDNWPARGVQYGILAHWLLRWNGPLSQWSARQGGAEGEAANLSSAATLVTRRQRLSRLAQHSSEAATAGNQGTNPQRYEAYMMGRLLRHERGKLRVQHHARPARGALRSLVASVRSASVLPVLYVLLGMGTTFAAVCVATSVAGQAGACGAVVAMMACTAGGMLYIHTGVSRRAASFRRVALWAAIGVLAALFPAVLCAAAILTSRIFASASTALHAAPARWAAMSSRSSGSSGDAVPVAYLQSFPNELAYKLSDAVLRVDVLGTGHAYWPLAPGTSPGKGSAVDVVGVTPGWAVPVTTSCAVPLVDARSAAADLTDPASVPPAAWVVCHNAGAGVASCTDALLGNFTAESQPAHEGLASCLTDLAAATQPALLFALRFDAYWGVPNARDLAAPAVRDAILRNGLPLLAYDNVTVLRLGSACCDEQPSAATTRAAATSAAMGCTVLALTAGFARYVDGHRGDAVARRRNPRMEAQSARRPAAKVVSPIC